MRKDGHSVLLFNSRGKREIKQRKRLRTQLSINTHDYGQTVGC